MTPYPTFYPPPVSIRNSIQLLPLGVAPQPFMVVDMGFALGQGSHSARRGEPPPMRLEHITG